MVFQYSKHAIPSLLAAYVVDKFMNFLPWQVPTNKGSICWMWQIFNQLGKEKKRRLFKIVSLIVLLFLSMFW
jgi:hypothetical protein